MVNKWGLDGKKTAKTSDKIKKEMMEENCTLSATCLFFLHRLLLNKESFQVMEKAVEVFHNKTKKVPTSALNDAMLPEIAHYPPPAIKGKLIQIKYITQVAAKTPTFAFFCNLPQYIQESYVRFLENRLREKFDFEGTPVRLFFQEKIGANDCCLIFRPRFFDYY